MKGTKKVTIDDKAYAFKFDLNALERFTEEAGVGLNGLDEALDKVANIKLFIQAFPLRVVKKSLKKLLELWILHN
jgi:hypothetical protein